MATPDAPHDLRTILAAAADVIFSDGVSDAFLDHWVDETLIMLSVRDRRPAKPPAVLDAFSGS
jgi:hypothetical protein